MRREENNLHTMTRATADVGREPPPESSTQGVADKLPGHFRSSDSSGAWWALGILLAGLALTALTARQEKLGADEHVRQAFGYICSEVELRVVGRLREHMQILRSGAAFFADDNEVAREEWHEYAERQKLDQNLPGIQGIGFAQLVPREQLAQVAQKIRDEGFPDFRIWPAGDRDIYSSIVFLEPFSGRNLRAFGYDMFSEPVRRAAMERARDRDEVALSGKVTLVQENGQDVQAGTLMYAPVYRMGNPHKTVVERQASFLGWVYSPYRMNDLMEGGSGQQGGARACRSENLRRRSLLPRIPAVRQRARQEEQHVRRHPFDPPRRN